MPSSGFPSSPSRVTAPSTTGGAHDPAPPPERPGFTPGLFLLQAQHLEALAETVLVWLSRYPADPLEIDTILVPSNGMAEWFKAESASKLGIFAGCRVELPGRFTWRVAQQLLGATARPSLVFDKAVLPWFLMASWPQWSALPLVAEQCAQAGLRLPRPAKAQPSADNRCDWLHITPELWRWCRQVADLFDQYQLYRADWLSDWAQGMARCRLRANDVQALPMPSEHQWQAQLWQWLEAQGGGLEASSTLGTSGAASTATPTGGFSRPALHRACLQRLREAAPGSLSGLPKRVVLFGATALAPPQLELLQAISRHAAVLLAVPNPCRAQWVDLADGAIQGQALLASWARQVRDFLDQLETGDERLPRLGLPRMGRAEREDPLVQDTALSFLQAAIHLNTPASESAAAVAAGAAPVLNDGSLHFNVAHTPLREVEILHDHLLHQLARPSSEDPPGPRDVVVMVPDLARYAAAIRAVFGAYGPDDPRHIPWGLADREPQADEGLCSLALWLLSLPSQRCTATELLTLLQTPAVLRRTGLDSAAAQRLRRWVADSGIRWGLTAAHRAALGFAAAGEGLSWRFGVDRMLAGYAHGAETSDDTVVARAGPMPLAEVSGLEAQAVGELAAILDRLERWRQFAEQPHPPEAWGDAFRQLLRDLLQPSNADEEREWALLDEALTAWLTATAQAAFAALLPLDIMREALQDQLSGPASRGRFRANGVTFCTLMPLRAIPFQLVYLMGMNDGDYPRPSGPTAGDLLANPRLARPGDRSRRLDDRQLMLDALLSARRSLVVSWVGRRASDNEAQPPSVLVGQLRDNLAAIWGRAAVNAITTEHPLHAYSPRYFSDPSLPATHAHEWEPLPDTPTVQQAPAIVESSASTAESYGDPLRMARWLRCPVTAFWADRLGVRWQDPTDLLKEDEPLTLVGLDAWSAWAAAVAELARNPQPANAKAWAEGCWDRLNRRGVLPLAAPAALFKHSFITELIGMQARLEHTIRQTPQAWHQLSPSRFLQSPGADPSKPSNGRLEQLLPLWWAQLQAAAEGDAWPVVLVTPDATVWGLPTDRSSAQESLARVRSCLSSWQSAALPMPATARLIAACKGAASQRAAALDREAERNPAWRRSFGRAQDWAWPAGGSSVGATRSVQDWADATEALYEPFWTWCQTQLRTTPAGLTLELHP